MRLLATYRSALIAYERVPCTAFQDMAPEHIAIHEAAQARKDAKVAVLIARRAYWRHV